MRTSTSTSRWIQTQVTIFSLRCCPRWDMTVPGPYDHSTLQRAASRLTMTLRTDAAKTAKAKLNYHMLNGKAIRIMWANKNARNRADRNGNIFIKARFLLLLFAHSCALCTPAHPWRIARLATRSTTPPASRDNLSSAAELREDDYNSRTARHLLRFWGYPFMQSCCGQRWQF